MQVFNKIGNVSSVSSVYRILKSELKISPYIYYIQQQDHFFKNQQEMANALSVLNFYDTLRSYIHISYDEYRKTKEQSYRQYTTDKYRHFPRSNWELLLWNAFCADTEKTVIWAFSIICDVTRRHSKNGYAEKMPRHSLNIA